MITEEKIKELVEGIAKKHAINTKTIAYDTQKRKEYEQELYLEAYSILKKQPEVTDAYLAMCLWNRVKELVNRDKKRTAQEFLTDVFQSEQENAQSVPNEVYDALYNKSVITTRNQNSDLIVQDGLNVIFQLLSGHSETLRTFVLAKLKINGYLPEDAFPEIDVSKIDQTANETENHQVLEKLLHLKNSKSGGPNKFKKEKRDFFLEVLSEFEIEDSYSKWYEYAYENITGQIVTDFVKKFSIEEATAYIKTLPYVKKIKYIKLGE